MTTQSVFDDLRRAEKTNTRIEMRLAAQLAFSQGLPDAYAEGHPETVALVRALGDAAWETKQDIRGILGRADTQTLDEHLGATPGDRAPIMDVLDFALDEITGTAGKRPVQIDVISPELYGNGTPVGDQLSGELWKHFFGFALHEARRADFGLGYQNVRGWWDASDVKPHPLLAPHELEAEAGLNFTPKDLGLWAKVKLVVRLGYRYVRAVVSRKG
jgi:hypothetical protein